MRAYPYVRVSTADQRDSPHAQLEQIKAYYEWALKPKGYELADVTEDIATSGAAPFGQRPNGSRLLTTPEAGDTVVIAKLDRGFRDTRDCLNTIYAWRARSVEVRILDIGVDTSTDVGQLILTVMAAVAEFERKRMSQRKRECNEVRRRLGLADQGNRWGHRLVGPRGKRRFVPDEEVLALARKCLAWRCAGWTYDQIYYHLLHERVLLKGREISRSWIQASVTRIAGMIARERAQKASN